MRKTLSLLICLTALLLGACATKKNEPQYPSGTASELQQGKRLFEQQHYTKAMKVLLPLACDCVAEAEYAVGYMYYNGYGVPQDTEMGKFWIRRSAQHGYKPATEALEVISRDKYTNTRSRQWPRGI